MQSFSKSRLVALSQCPKRLWLQSHQPELAEETGDPIRLDGGKAVGEMAHQLYNPDGRAVLVDTTPANFAAALSQTHDLLNGKQPIFEACLEANGVRVYIDALLPDPQSANAGYRMVEVKSSTRVKEHHLDDVAIQVYAARAAGVPLTSVALAHVNSSWTYPGANDYSGLLVEQDLTHEALERAETVAELVNQAQQVAAQPNEPQRHTGPHCLDPYPCPFFTYCRSQEERAEHPIAWLPSLRSKAVKEHIDATGASDMRDLPDNLLTAKQQRVKTATVHEKPYFDRAQANRMLRAFQPPLYFLDFETIQFPVPIWPGTRPYQQIPFQFSLHRQDGEEFKHAEFLDLSGNDPQRAFAEALVAACGDRGSVVAYSASFERTRIKELAAAFADLETPLLALNNRVVDLLPIARECYYHPHQHGSWSIKAVLPALCPDLSYEQLDGVQNGTLAQQAFIEAIAASTPRARQNELQAQLLDYCKLDTWAMVRVWQALRDS